MVWFDRDLISGNHTTVSTALVIQGNVVNPNQCTSSLSAKYGGNVFFTLIQECHNFVTHGKHSGKTE